MNEQVFPLTLGTYGWNTYTSQRVILYKKIIKSDEYIALIISIFEMLESNE